MTEVSDEQGEMIRDLVAKFVARELMPLEPLVMQRAATGIAPALPPEDAERLGRLSRELGLWGLDAPEDMGGMNLPPSVMAGVAEELGKTVTPFIFPPDSPNLHMLKAVGTPEQLRRYLQPYVDGTMTSAIAISEPGAGSDPAGLQTRARRDGDDWLINGRKIWITNAATADFLIVMARVGDGERHAGVTAFIVEKGAPGLVIEREIAMLGTHTTYEILFDDCRVPGDALLGEVGQGYAPMQLRLLSRRLEMASTCVGMAQRALDIMTEHARGRVTFGAALADRQAIQWWVADIATRLYACRLMIRDAALKMERGGDIRHEAGIIKVFATEMAGDALDHAMQTLGALGMTRETPLYLMWNNARLMRIYEGPSEVHRQTIARRIIGAGR